MVLTLRQRVPRLGRESLAFSRKLANPIGVPPFFISHDAPEKATA
jgi:hypothetical protein